MFAYTIVHLTFRAREIVVRAQVYANVYLTCAYYKDKVNVRSISLTINPEPSLGIQTLFHKERNNRQVSCLPRTNQPDNFLSTMFQSNEYVWSFPAFVGLRLLVNILIGTLGLCRNRDFVQIT